MPHLLVVKGPNSGHQVDLDRARIIVGREPECDIALNSAETGSSKKNVVSRKHAFIERVKSEYYIEDGDGNGHPSRNGTVVNDAKLPECGRRKLSYSDIIKICDYTFVFLDGPPGESSSSVIEAAIDHDSGSLFTQTAEKLKLLLEIGNRLSHTLKLDKLLPQVVDSLLQHFKNADRAFLIGRDEGSYELVTRIVKSRRPGNDASEGYSVAIVEQCMEKVQGLLITDPESEFPTSDSVAGLLLRSVMCAPLWSQDGKAFGVMLLDSQDSCRQFTQEDLNLLMGVASQASIALENARYHRDALDRERLDRDLNLAREVAKSFLPAKLPIIPGYEFFAFNESAHEVGGDYYDLIELGGKKLAILLGDVTGKGVAAALVMARFSAEARVHLRTATDLPSAVRQFNTSVQPLTLTDRFVTLAAVLLDPATHTVAVVNAGHPPPLMLRGGTGALETLSSGDGPPLGVLDRYAYESSQVLLHPGDTMVVFSDGVTEAMDINGRQFGPQGLRLLLQREAARREASGGAHPHRHPRARRHGCEQPRRHHAGLPRPHEIGRGLR